MKRASTDDLKAEPKVRDYIGLGDCTKDNVDIMEDRKAWCDLRWCFTVYNGVEGKYVQVWKIAEVHEFRKWELPNWLRNLSDLHRIIRNTTPTSTSTHSHASEMQFLQCVTSRIEDRLQTGHPFLVIRSYRKNTQIWPKEYWCVKPKRWDNHLFDKAVRAAVV